MSVSTKAVNGAIDAALASSTSIFFYLLTAFLVLGYLYWRVTRRHKIQLAENIPGPKGWPLIGNLLEILGSPVDIFATLFKYGEKYDGVIKAWAGHILVIFLTDPRDVEIILSSNVNIDKSAEYGFFRPWLGNGLLNGTGDKWRAHRKLIAPAFHLNVLKGFVDLFNVNSRAIVEKMRKMNGESFDCHDYMAEASLGMLLETVMGVSRNTRGQDGHKYARAVLDMSDVLHLRHVKPWLRMDWVFYLSKYGKLQGKLLSIIHGLTRQVLKNKKDLFSSGIRGTTAEVPKEFLGNSEAKEDKTAGRVSFGKSTGIKDDLDIDDNDVRVKTRLAFLDLMLESSENGSNITDEEIKEEIDTIMFAGYEAAAVTSSFFLSLMGLHEDIQEKVHQELDDIFGDSDRPVTFADTLEMKYLDRCLLETLRLYPTVPVVARNLKHDVKMASGDYTLPAGCTVVIGTIKIHRRPEIYPNPEKFNPDHFLPERTANRHYYAFIPFSAGPRSCVGRKYAMLKLKILLSTILRNFDVKSDLEEKDFQLKANLTLKRAEGFPIRLLPRKSKTNTNS